MNRRVRLLLTVLLGALLLVGIAGTGAQAASSTSGPLESGILASINQVRAQQGLRPLSLSPRLGASALEHSWSMAYRGYFSHFSRDGTSFGTRISHFYGTRGYSVWRVGETIFWATPDAMPQQMVAAWLASPSHRAIVLSPVFHQIGLGVVHAASAPGPFAGRPVTIVTADYGIRR